MKVPISVAAVTVTALLAGCASPAPASPEPEPTAATRPAIPDGWTTLTSEDGDIRLVVPPDIGLMFTASGSLVAQAPISDGIIPFEVWAVGPGELGPRGAGQSISQWMEEQRWLPPATEEVMRGPTTERDTVLPAGRAVELTTSIEPGTRDESRVLLSVIETEGGLALLRFVGTPAAMDERTTDMELMSRLIEFGD